MRVHNSLSEKKALLKIFKNNSWVTGDDLGIMEQHLSKLFKKKHVVLTANGFSALFMSIKGLKISNQVIYLPEVSSCFAMVNAIIASGNTPGFLPVDMMTGNIDINLIRVKNLKSKYIIFPNHNGITGDTKHLKELGFIIIEDCAQSFLSSSKRLSHADVIACSFYPTKSVNGIDGGAILTNNPNVYKIAQQKTYYNNQTKFDGIERFNFRLPNLHAAVFNENVIRIPTIIKKMKSIKNKYDSAIADKMERQRSLVPTDVLYKYILICKNSQQKKKLVSLANKHEIELSKGYINISDKKINTSSFNVIKHTIQLPFYEDLKNHEINKVVKFLNDIRE